MNKTENLGIGSTMNLILLETTFCEEVENEF